MSSSGALKRTFFLSFSGFPVNQELNSFYEVNVTLIRIADRHITRREEWKSICLINIAAKIFNKHLEPNSVMH